MDLYNEGQLALITKFTLADFKVGATYYVPVFVYKDTSISFGLKQNLYRLEKKTITAENFLALYEQFSSSVVLGVRGIALAHGPYDLIFKLGGVNFTGVEGHGKLFPAQGGAAWAQITNFKIRFHAVNTNVQAIAVYLPILDNVVNWITQYNLPAGLTLVNSNKVGGFWQVAFGIIPFAGEVNFTAKAPYELPGESVDP